MDNFLRVEKLQREKREKKNMLIKGIPMEKIDNKELKEQMVSFITHNLEINIKVIRTGEMGPNTCIVETENMEDKIKIMKNENKLRNIIESDMTKREREIQKLVSEKVKDEKDKGKQVKVYINGRMWKCEEETEKLIKYNNYTATKK
ncbi:hypothetical protein ILUMI_08885 [Ignelater luminosus]|uniref:Uncharacterized protein n=1 Tax=Ignelater luminosus TaxID=2038154 RepID=A0A8K0D3I7_IGNLU|nr:hypothetical protein ILUMI_08885 [Ignelater luminosus]